MLIDAHAHLDFYDDQMDAVLAETVQHGIFTVSTSVDLPSYQRNLELAEKCPLVLPAFGIHPWHAHKWVDRLDELEEATVQSPLLGEIGLDFEYVEDTSRFPAQRRVFDYFLAAAREQNKIVNLHTSGAEEEIAQLLDSYTIERAIIHWYAGSLDTLRALTDRGYYFTVGVEVMHSERAKTIARELPPHLLLTETDNPGGLEWVTGTRGMPALIKDVVQTLAEVRETTEEDIIETVRANFLALIDQDPRLADTYGLVSGSTRDKE